MTHEKRLVDSDDALKKTNISWWKNLQLLYEKEEKVTEYGYDFQIDATKIFIVVTFLWKSQELKIVYSHDTSLNGHLFKSISIHW